MEKIQSLKENFLFNKAYSKGRSAVRRSIVVYAYKNSRVILTRLGITINKKLGSAVERNRARRMIREAFRQLWNKDSRIAQSKTLIVIVARSRCFDPKVKTQVIYRDLKSALFELKLMAE